MKRSFFFCVAFLVVAAACGPSVTTTAQTMQDTAIGTIRYVVRTSDDRTTDISYTDKAGDIIKTRTDQERWETSFEAPLSGVFQVWGFDMSDNVQPVSCELWVNGKLLSDNTTRPREMATGCTWSP